ncbi:SDR family oxidoreductase [Paenibacillus sp. DYY-L-2]|uniref:SDR family oxidoreductase n=1 Tax=Paenibacillus sp. DYY-L-2 TaxID=3447013 RepID=UPI003F50BDDE
MKKLNRKIALVTGASRGIGRAIALRLAEEGALVAVHYAINRDAAEEVVREIERNGGNAFALGKEIQVFDDVEALFAELDEELMRRTGDRMFDILVNNAGKGLPVAMEGTTEEAFDEIFRINVKAPFFIIQQALSRLRSGGRIMNLSSAVTRISLPGIPAYTMTKGAIDALTLSLANQLGPQGITINALKPGFVATDMNASMLDDPDSNKFGAEYSIFGRWGAPSDIADVAAFLASEESRWVTGQCIDVSGGSRL